MVAEVAPSYDFIYANANMMNVRADDAHFPLVYCEEITAQRYDSGPYGALSKYTTFELYFMRRAPMQGEALGRDAIREQIEQEAVVPFLKALALMQPNTTAISSELPPAMFDDNDVAVMLRFEWREAIC